MAPATILRVLATKGVTEAVKKFGKKAVDEARKHAKDMVTKPTPGQKKVKKAVSGQRANRETLRKAGTTGAAVGAAATYGARQMGGNSDSSKPKATPAPKAKAKAKDPRANPSDYPTYRKESKSAVSFREAQRKAKNNGQKTFTWEGRRYNTKEK